MQANELVQRIKSGRAPIIVDARGANEYKIGHVPGAIRASVVNILMKKVKFPDDKNVEMVVYCMRGGRARIARALLARQGFCRLDLLQGDWQEWVKAGLPVEK